MVTCLLSNFAVCRDAARHSGSSAIAELLVVFTAFRSCLFYFVIRVVYNILVVFWSSTVGLMYYTMIYLVAF